MASDLMSDKDLVSAFEKGLQEHVREPAQKHSSEAIGTLAKLMKSSATPPNVRRQCAQDLLSQGWGRPDAREDTSGQRTVQGLTINIIRLSDGSSEQISLDIEQAMEIAASVDSMAQEPTKEIPVNAPKYDVDELFPGGKP